MVLLVVGVIGLAIWKRCEWFQMCGEEDPLQEILGAPPGYGVSSATHGTPIRTIEQKKAIGNKLYSQSPRIDNQGKPNQAFVKAQAQLRHMDKRRVITPAQSQQTGKKAGEYVYAPGGIWKHVSNLPKKSSVYTGYTNVTSLYAPSRRIAI